MKPVLTIDGPSGSGKGTIAARIAQDTGWMLLDSGALYRLTGLACDRKDIDLEDEASVAEVARNLDVEFDQSEGSTRVLLEQVDVTATIRTEKVAALASRAAKLPQVRTALLQRQRDFAAERGLVADGRDMGTVVFPEAPAKVYLTASAEERAKRRVLQLQEQGERVEFDSILADIQARDDRDMNRDVAPLKPADDALEIDSSKLSIEEVIQQVEKLLIAKGLIK